jgi:hypothetical protein
VTLLGGRRWRGSRALTPPPFCTGGRSFSGRYRDETWDTTPQNRITSLASFIFPSHQNFQDDPFNRKSHGTCFWDRKGFLLVDFMPNGTTINAEAYCNTLKKLRRAIQNRRRGMLTRGVSLLHDNARPHTAPVSQELLTSFGWDIITHPLFTRLGAFGLSLFH